MLASDAAAQWRRRDWVLLALLGTVHVALLLWAARAALAVPFALYEPRPFLRLGLCTLIVVLPAMAIAWRAQRIIAWGTAVAVAMALMSPGVVVTIALLLLNASIIGSALARAVGADEQERAITMLLGLTVWIGVIAATAAANVHSAPVYAAALLAPIVIGHRHAANGIKNAAALLRPPLLRPDVFELSWTALLVTVTVIHLVIVAKPDAGYDANTMHLQVPLMMASAHHFGFDVGRYAWALMPLGADWAFTAAYFLGGESAARLANFCFGALAAAILYTLIRRQAPRTIGLASITLLASTPLAFLETGSLFAENLWLAYLLAALLVALKAARHPSPGAICVLGLLAAGALQCKVIGVLWLAPLFAGLILLGWRRLPGGWNRRHFAVLALAVTVGAWPYANAWLRTGNPVFPYLNAWFRSPAFDTSQNFSNDTYVTPLRPWTLHETIMQSHSFIEGFDGAAGFHWLLLIPLIIVALLRRGQWRAPAALLFLGAFFFITVYLQQSYLRYLLPAFFLLAVLGGWSLAALPARRVTSVAILAIGTVVGVLQIRLIYTGSWINSVLCSRCGFDAGARERYLATFMPDRLIGETLNRLLPPDARVGFLTPNAPNPAGYLGYSRATNWHDVAAFEPIATADSEYAVMQVVQRFRLTHVVCRDPFTAEDTPAIRAFCSDRIVPLWRAHGRVVGTLKPNGG
ncbi:MAG: glycosyltransferase family 39 protein [Betaproteobacteria bacterium]